MFVQGYHDLRKEVSSSSYLTDLKAAEIHPFVCDAESTMSLCGNFSFVAGGLGLDADIKSSVAANKARCRPLKQGFLSC